MDFFCLFFSIPVSKPVFIFSCYTTIRYFGILGVGIILLLFIYRRKISFLKVFFVKYFIFIESLKHTLKVFINNLVFGTARNFSIIYILVFITYCLKIWVFFIMNSKWLKLVFQFWLRRFFWLITLFSRADPKLASSAWNWSKRCSMSKCQCVQMKVDQIHLCQVFFLNFSMKHLKNIIIIKVL